MAAAPFTRAAFITSIASDVIANHFVRIRSRNQFAVVGRHHPGGFKVTLKGRGLVLIRKGNGRLNAPWAVPGGMRYFAGIVAAEPVFQIVGQASVMLEKTISETGLPSRSSSACTTMHKPAFALGGLRRGSLRLAALERRLEAAGVESTAGFVTA